MNAQDEIERLKREVERLRKALGERQQLSAPNLPSLRDNYEFIADLARFASGTLEEKYVRRKYHLLDEAAWELLGKDEALIEKIEETKIARLRSGATKRELAQMHIVRGPSRLATIMDDPKANYRHVVDAIKTLDALAEPSPSHFTQDQDRIVIRIDMGADVRLKNGESNPADVLIVDTVVRPNPNPNDTKVIDNWDAPKQIELNQEEPVPPKRGPGRPPGSKNKPKLDQQQPLPGFLTE